MQSGARLSLSSGNVNRELVMNVQPGAHLLLTPGGVNRRPVVNAQPGAHRSLASVARGLSSCGLRALEHRLSSHGTWAQLLRGMWELPGPGLEPVSPPLAGGFLTTAPPGKSLNTYFRLKKQANTLKTDLDIEIILIKLVDFIFFMINNM